MSNKKKKIIKIGAIVIAAGLIVGISVALYLWNLPHRDVQGTATDYELTTSELVTEYINDWDNANAKYLAEDGRSKVLEVTGTVVRVTENFNGQKVVFMREEGDKAGINFTFLPEASSNAEKLNPGQVATLKGVIRSGVYFDKDLEMFVHAVVDNADLVADNQ